MHRAVKHKLQWQLVVFIAVSLCYLDLILAAFTGMPAHFFMYLLMACCAAPVISLAATLFKKSRVNYWVLVVIFVILAVLYSVQIGCSFFYHNYMSLESILAGVGGVVTGFQKEIWYTIGHTWWMMLLTLLPIGAQFVLHRLHLISFKQGSVKSRLFAFGLFLIFFGISRIVLATNETASGRYASQYDYETSSNYFGLLTGTRLDLRYMLFGNKAAGEIIIVDPEPDPQEDEPADPEEIDYGYNELDLDWDSIIAQGKFSKIDTYVSGLKASSKNEYTGLFKGKNLILITAEAFTLEAIDPVLTPTLYRMATKGIQIKDAYQPAWGGSTSTGEFSIISGMLPTSYVKSSLTAAPHNNYMTLGNSLQRLGYFSRAYHNHLYNYYDRDKTLTHFGYSEYIGYGTGMEKYVQYVWPESDLDMMIGTVEEYATHEPFSVYYMTVSGHTGYTFAQNAMSRKNKDLVQDVEGSEVIQGYYACNIELDRGLEYLINRLDQLGIMEDTVIAMSADHYPYGLDEVPSQAGYNNALSELFGYNWSQFYERDHNSIIIWSGCLERPNMEPIVVETPVYTLDIAPTLANLFGLEFDSRFYVGRDILAPDTEPLVMWIDRSWATEKAYYNAKNGKITPREGYEGTITDDYVKRINAIVSNKFAYSKTILENDYFTHIFGPDNFN